jgi:hypothetical protein
MSAIKTDEKQPDTSNKQSSNDLTSLEERLSFVESLLYLEADADLHPKASKFKVKAEDGSAAEP